MDDIRLASPVDPSKPRRGPKPRCINCHEETREGLKNEQNKTICGGCSRLCAWCNAPDASTYDEDGARCCEKCAALPGPQKAKKSAT